MRNARNDAMELMLRSSSGLDAAAVDPFGRVAALIGGHPIEHRAHAFAKPYIFALLVAYKAFADHVIHHAAQGCVVAANVVESARIAVQPKLSPGQHFEHLIHGAVATGQGNESIG